jgi:outer membrane protein assembly factor BamB
VASYPVSCQRLANGNTFIATYTEVLEVTPGGKVLYSHAGKVGSVFCAEKLRNGNILLARGDGSIVEMDTRGKEVKSVRVGGLSSWAGVEVLPGGRYLVAQYQMNRVVEVDSRGTVLWQYKIRTPAWATRLGNGHTLIASPDGRKVVEVDPKGKEVWAAPTKGRPFRIRRY